MSQVTCSTGLEPGNNDHGGDAEVVEAGSDCGGPDHGGQDVRPGGFRSQGPRLFHQPPSPLLPTPCTSCNTLDGRWRTFSRLGVALWQSPRRRKRRLRDSWLLSLPCSPLRRHLGIAWHNKPQEICPGTGRYIVKLHTHFYPHSAFCLLQKLPIRGGLFIKNPTDIKGLLPYNPKHIDIDNGYPTSKV